MPESATTALLAALRGLGSSSRFFAFDAAPATGELLTARALLDPAALLPRVLRFGAQLGTDEPRVAASLWSKPYTQALLSGTLAALALRGVGLDARLDNISILFNDRGKPSAVQPHDLGATMLYAPRWDSAVRPNIATPTAGLAKLHARVGEGLFRGHLEPLFDALYEATGIAPQILWGNASNRIAILYLKLAAQPGAGGAVAADRRYFLEAADSPLTATGNPLHDDGTYLALNEPGLPATIHVRRTCCLRYRLDTPRYCYTCPLVSREQRRALLRERLED